MVRMYKSKSKSDIDEEEVLFPIKSIIKGLVISDEKCRRIKYAVASIVSIMCDLNDLRTMPVFSGCGVSGCGKVKY